MGLAQYSSLLIHHPTLVRVRVHTSIWYQIRFFPLYSLPAAAPQPTAPLPTAERRQGCRSRAPDASPPPISLSHLTPALFLSPAHPPGAARSSAPACNQDRARPCSSGRAPRRPARAARPPAPSPATPDAARPTPLSPRRRTDRPRPRAARSSSRARRRSLPRDPPRLRPSRRPRSPSDPRPGAPWTAAARTRPRPLSRQESSSPARPRRSFPAPRPDRARSPAPARAQRRDRAALSPSSAEPSPSASRCWGSSARPLSCCSSPPSRHSSSRSGVCGRPTSPHRQPRPSCSRPSCFAPGCPVRASLRWVTAPRPSSDTTLPHRSP
jgi:hypothetical protein